ncbi:MAG: hypothetical protein Kapaf2KO_18490 [Candidatus Kapaibacteriales bacterium]
MKEEREIELDFLIDKLTNSIQNTISGDSFSTQVSRFTINDSKVITKQKGWNFDWKAELENDLYEVYKLSIINNPNITQGLLSLRRESDHIFINLLESAPFNIGKNKLYEGVAGNLVAFACKLSFQYGFEGFVSFPSKTKLIEHYKKTIGAINLTGNKMIIPTDSSKVLIIKYFKT